MILVVCFLTVTTVVVECSSLHRERRSVITLQASVTADIDIEARRELLFLIVGKINDTVKAQTKQNQECEKKINKTIDACNTCHADMCTPSASLTTTALNTIQTGLNYPVVYAGKSVEAVGKWFAGSTTWMGDRAGKFSMAVGSTANTVGASLQRSGNQAISTLGRGFNTLGNEFISSGNKLIDASKNSLGGVLGLGSGISNIDNLVGGALNSFQNGFNSFISNVGNSISNTATSVWDSTFGKLIRKRSTDNLRNRRCTKSCPICDDLNTDKYTVDQITTKVCGAANVQGRNDDVQYIAFLQNLFNTTVSEDLISAIEFETNSIDYSTGTPTFSISFYTIDGVRTQLNGLFDSSNHKDTGKKIAKQYFATV